MRGSLAYIGAGSALLIAGIYASQSSLLDKPADTAVPAPSSETAPAAQAKATPAPPAPNLQTEAAPRPPAPIVQAEATPLPAAPTPLTEAMPTAAAPAAEVAATPAPLAAPSAESEAAVARLTAELAMREAETSRLKTALALRDGVLDTLKATVAERETALADLNGALQASTAEIRSLQATLAQVRGKPKLTESLVLYKADAAPSAVRLEPVRSAGGGLDAIFAAKVNAAASWAPPAGVRPTVVEVQFDFASAELTPGGQAHASAAALALADMDLAQVRVIGHTDRVGTPAANRRLAAKRARIVAEVLIAAGLPAALIETDGMGEADPPIATDDGVAEPLNRSVAIIAVPLPVS